ncbi:Tat pathway signal sequence domain protein [Kitasatospora sp. NA04385]|nr:Tat pathway signal sequence domain protein [Kitasatospora sp. NA04385]
MAPALAVGLLALPGAVAFADTASPTPVPSAAASVSATPAPAPAPSSARVESVSGTGAVPRGGAQTGEGAVDGGSTTGLVLGGGLAAAGAAGIGLLVVRRRAAGRA